MAAGSAVDGVEKHYVLLTKHGEFENLDAHRTVIIFASEH